MKRQEKKVKIYYLLTPDDRPIFTNGRGRYGTVASYTTPHPVQSLEIDTDNERETIKQRVERYIGTDSTLEVIKSDNEILRP